MPNVLQKAVIFQRRVDEIFSKIHTNLTTQSAEVGFSVTQPPDSSHPPRVHVI
jgi:hypothetical protein